MKELSTFLNDKRNLASLLGLVLMIAIIPLGVYLARFQQTFFSKASGTLIQLADGDCVVTTENNEKALKCSTVPLILINPFNLATPEASATASPIATESAAPSTSTPSAQPSASASASAQLSPSQPTATPAATAIPTRNNPNSNANPNAFKPLATPVPTPTPSPAPTTSSPTPQPQSYLIPQSFVSEVKAAKGDEQGQKCTPGKFGSVSIAEGQNCGQILSSPDLRADSGVISYKAPEVNFSEAVCNIVVKTHNSNNGGCVLSADQKGTADNPLTPGESVDIKFSNDCSLINKDNSNNANRLNGCKIPLIVRPAATPAPPITSGISYRIAEAEKDLPAAVEKQFDGNQDTMLATYLLKDDEPGLKTLWVEFKNKLDGRTVKDSLNVVYVSDAGLVQGASCTTELGSDSLNVNVKGMRLGADEGKASIKVNGREIAKEKWDSEHIKAKWTAPDQPPTNGKQYNVDLTTSDGKSVPTVKCAVNTSLVSLGARLFCRGQGNYDLKDVKIQLIDEEGKKAEETVNINKDGTITGIKTQLEQGKNYVLSIKAPLIARTNVYFTAEEGTTIVKDKNGGPIVLPIGDIAPRPNGDGGINTIDRSLLLTQWRNLPGSEASESAEATQTADLNIDKRVNSFDWACMRYDFNRADEPIPDKAPPSQTETDQSQSNENGNNGKAPGPNNKGCITDTICGSDNRCFRYNNLPGTCRPADTVCAQTITRACRNNVDCNGGGCTNENGKECIDFPTPCVVPPDWQVIEANSSQLSESDPKTNKIKNGSFEKTQVTAITSWQYFGISEDTNIADWNPKTRNSEYQVELQKDLYGPAAEGHQYAEVDQENITSLTQSVTTEPGKQYELKFAYSPRPDAAAQSMAVYWNGQVVGTVSGAGVVGGKPKWIYYSYTVTAPTTTSTIGFRSIKGSKAGNFIDDISLIEISD